MDYMGFGYNSSLRVKGEFYWYVNRISHSACSSSQTHHKYIHHSNILMKYWCEQTGQFTLTSYSMIMKILHNAFIVSTIQKVTSNTKVIWIIDS